ncbi:hypothetical protein AHiyo8_44460 [Arthrobacter sp. Hiyo8]|nr:hypothetical protein AHiyo8_44460 [Arthrobacter sp. Hiyo8]
MSTTAEKPAAPDSEPGAAGRTTAGKSQPAPAGGPAKQAGSAASRAATNSSSPSWWACLP